jgi:hypothetical protein
MGVNRTPGPGAADRRGRATHPFDPLASMRAMADVQADALRAAGDLLERVLGADGEAPAPQQRSYERGYAALLEAWADVLQRLAAGLARPPDGPMVAVPVDADVVGPSIRIVVGQGDGAEGATAEIWLHNGTSAAVGPLALRSGPLTASDGTALDGAEMRFDPAEVALLAPRSSRAVTVSLAADGQLAPGIYRGAIQARGAPKVWLPVEVAVEPC